MATSSNEHRSIVSAAKKVSSFRNLRSSSNSKKEEGRKLTHSSSKGKGYNEKDLVKDVKKLKNVLCHFIKFKFMNSDLYKEEDWLEHICSSPSGKSGKTGIDYSSSGGISKSSKCLTSQPSSQPSISQQPSEGPSNIPSTLPSYRPTKPTITTSTSSTSTSTTCEYSNVLVI